MFMSHQNPFQPWSLALIMTQNKTCIEIERIQLLVALVSVLQLVLLTLNGKISARLQLPRLENEVKQWLLFPYVLEERALRYQNIKGADKSCPSV